MDATAASGAGNDTRSVRERLERRIWRASKPIAQRLMARTPPQRIFVAGMQRSGTNMLMEMLEWSLWTDVYHETDPRAFDNYEMRPVEVIRALVERSVAPFFIIKSLCELDRLGQLMEAFAPARIVWIVRSYDDSTNSAVRSFSYFSDQLHRLVRDKSAAGWRGRGMSDDTQALLRKVHHPKISESSAAALMWYYRNILFFEQRFDRDPRVQLVHYEDLVSDPPGVMRQLFESLGIPGWSPWVGRYVHRRSIGRSPQADIAPEVRALCDELQLRFRARRPA